MPEVLAAELERHLNGIEPGRLFRAPKGGQVRPNGFRGRFWHPAVERAGLEPGLRTHALRHSHVAFLIDSGTNILAISRRLGHTDIRTTLGVYGHLLHDDEGALVEGLDRIAGTVVERSSVPTASMFRE
jgi:integrase